MAKLTRLERAHRDDQHRLRRSLEAAEQRTAALGERIDRLTAAMAARTDTRGDRRFVGEAEDFRQPGEPRRIIVASDLLDELGVSACARSEQERAVKEWLANNRPHKVLAISLRKAGFTVDQPTNQRRYESPGR